MPPLSNPKWEDFAQRCAAGSSKRQAAADCGYSEGQASTMGGRLAKKVEIGRRIAELQSEQAKLRMRQAAFSRQWVVDRLIDNVVRCMAKDDYQPRPAIEALRLMGVQLGMFVTKQEIRLPKIEDLTDEELVVLLERMEGSSARVQRLRDQTCNPDLGKLDDVEFSTLERLLKKAEARQQQSEQQSGTNGHGH